MLHDVIELREPTVGFAALTLLLSRPELLADRLHKYGGVSGEPDEGWITGLEVIADRRPEELDGHTPLAYEK